MFFNVTYFISCVFDVGFEATSDWAVQELGTGGAGTSFFGGRPGHMIMFVYIL